MSDANLVMETDLQDSLGWKIRKSQLTLLTVNQWLGKIAQTIGQSSDHGHIFWVSMCLHPGQLEGTDYVLEDLLKKNQAKASLLKLGGKYGRTGSNVVRMVINKKKSSVICIFFYVLVVKYGHGQKKCSEQIGPVSLTASGELGRSLTIWGNDVCDAWKFSN